MNDSSIPSPEVSKTASSEVHRDYVMRISRLTVDKLGVKLYDKASAVVAELVANGFDADADEVWVRLPLSTSLASKEKDGTVTDGGYFIEVIDDGHGMTPDEVIDSYLLVGNDRRLQHRSLSRERSRPVMGRKGIGKLSPFGICKSIEVISAGGERTEKGYTVAHFYMNYDQIVVNTADEVTLASGPLDRTFQPNRGTVVRMTNFAPKRVPDLETFHRQLAYRFHVAKSDFKIIIEDLRHPDINPVQEVRELTVPTEDGTRIDLATRPVVMEDGTRLQVSGWIGMAKDSYKNEEMAGVRIYARKKIVAMTRDFEQPAGFTGEFTVRSYLVGEVHAEWLDLDEGEDLVRTDRQGILWDSEYGQALRAWGSDLIKEIGAMTRTPRRAKTRAIFLQKSDFVVKAKAKFSDPEIVKVATEIANQIGSFAAEDELEDESYIDGLVEVILSVAPHKALIQAFQDFNKEVAGGETTLEKLSDIFGKTRIAELASYSQIAAERVQVIRELEKIVLVETEKEDAFQKLIADAPWLIEPTWSVISKNQALKTFKQNFEAWWKQTHDGEEITLAIDFERKRPDFTLVSVGYMLHIVEIKPSGHEFNDGDFKRLLNYVYAFRKYFLDHESVRNEFPRGWSIDLIADGVKMTDLSNIEAFDGLLKNGQVKRIPWKDFLAKAKIAHEMFLDINDKVAVRALPTP